MKNLLLIIPILLFSCQKVEMETAFAKAIQPTVQMNPIPLIQQYGQRFCHFQTCNIVSYFGKEYRHNAWAVPTFYEYDGLGSTDDELLSEIRQDNPMSLIVNEGMQYAVLRIGDIRFYINYNNYCDEHLRTASNRQNVDIYIIAPGVLYKTVADVKIFSDHTNVDDYSLQEMRLYF